MVFKNKLVNKFWRFSSSFQLGIPIMVVLAALIAWGTIVESQLDANAAKKIVYGSWMMWTTMSLLVYNLTIVVVDRWPWKWHHYPFIVVHAGIIILIFGGYITYKYGLDGQMVVGIGGKNNLATVSNTDVVVYATFDGDRYSKIADREVDFFNHPPTAQKPYEIELGVDKIKITDYVPYAMVDNKVKKSTDPKAGASVRFQIMNARVKQVEQITQAKKDKLATYNLGPAKVHLGEIPENLEPANEIYLTPLNDNEVKYTVFHKEQKKAFKTGKMKIGDVVNTGWMGLEVRLLDYLPLASEEYEVIKKEKPTDLTTSAVLIEHKDVKRWVVLNDLVKLFGNESAFLMSYQNRRIPLGFELKLIDFKIKKYQGISKAMGYESQVETVKEGEPNRDETISMNEPMKIAGYTIYQASFQQDPNTGEATASVFSINRDPGRVTKYLGSLILSLGIVWLFVQRRKRKTSV
ncbi:MAG: cytochrome c biogenesis protein ResB [Pseudobdellovibrio sp.]